MKLEKNRLSNNTHRQLPIKIKNRRVIVSFTLQIKSDNMVLTIIQLMSENVQNSTIENFYFENLNICNLIFDGY